MPLIGFRILSVLAKGAVRICEGYALAEQYVAKKVVGLTNLADCQHIVIATLNKADVLVRSLLNP